LKSKIEKMRFTHFWGQYLLFAFVVLCSCNKNDEVFSEISENLIKSVISSDGKIISRYIYNQNKFIDELQSPYYWNKYEYDNNGRLIREFYHINWQLMSSSYYNPNQELKLMTSTSTEFNQYKDYEYDNFGKLKVIKYYGNANGEMVQSTLITFEYENEHIIKRIFTDHKSAVTRFETYEYDSKGNVLKEKNYSLFSREEPQLTSETTYKYDNKNNPYRVFYQTGQPGLYTNRNNIIEKTYSSFEDIDRGVERKSTIITSYTYNSKGFPVKVDSNGSVSEYRYK
ncbi:MAG: hypothetical protein ACOYEG_14210, partial [Petrimonas sp.]